MGARLGVERAVFEGRAIERALFWGRCTGGSIILLLGPIVTPAAPEAVIRALGLYFFAYATLMLWVSSRAASAAAKERAAWLAHAFDTLGFLGALALNATDTGWLATNAAPLYIVVAVSRLGLFGGVSALVALAATHLALAVWRDVDLGIGFDLARTLVHLGMYGLAVLLTTAIDSELRALRARREMQVAVHEPLLQAHDDMHQGVLISERARPVYVSDGLLRLTGWTRDEVMRLPSVFDLVPEDERSEAIEMTRALPAEGGLVTKTIRCRDGRRIEVEVALRRYRHDGHDRSVAIVRDVTVRKRTLEELARMQRLDGLGALAGGIAHDFSNLLAVILNNAHLALASAADGEMLRTKLEGIRSAAESGASLTRQMLVFSSGATPRPTVAIDLRREARYADQLLRRTIGDGIRLDVRIDPDVESVRLEPGQLEQILMNLAVNARDAMPDGGRISVEIDEIENDGDDLPALPSGRYVRIVVRDDGVGMAPGVAARAFEPFFTTKPKGRGTGLGLSTVYGLVRRAGGHVSIASAPAVGTSVTIHLPAATAAEMGESTAGGRREVRGSGEHVLAVDDEDGEALRTPVAVA
ncbi:MAG: PAS domain S-box protein [Chloroflexi bacterium]|nr:PAS domain S-box protein [Chloroflexota bacterium]